jgi:hypothetical protein
MITELVENTLEEKMSKLCSEMHLKNELQTSNR